MRKDIEIRIGDLVEINQGAMLGEVESVHLDGSAACVNFGVFGHVSRRMVKRDEINRVFRRVESGDD